MKRRDEILEFIKKFMMEHQYPPTVREIGDGVGMKSTSTVYVHIEKLIKEGRIEMDGSARTIRVKGIEYREV